MEEVLGIIMATEYGHIPVFHCNLVFTANRLIVAKKGWFDKQNKQDIAFMIGGLVGYWIATRSDKKQAQKPTLNSVEEILKTDKKNYEIPYSDILKAEMKKLSPLSVPYSVEVNVSAEKKKRKFKLKNVKFEEAVDLFRTVLHDKVSAT